MAQKFYQCTRCSVKTFFYTKLLQHLELYHESEFGFSVICGFQGCPRQYSRIRALIKHIKKHHKDQEPNLSIETENGETCIDLSEFEEADEYLENIDIISNPTIHGKWHDLTETFQKQIALFALSLHEKPVVPRVVQTSVINGIRALFTNFHQQYNSLLKTWLQSQNMDLQYDDTSLLLKSDVVETCFGEVNSEYQLDKYCLKELNLIEPVEYVLGYDQNGKKETFQYIPLLDLISVIVRKTDIWHGIQQPTSYSKNILEDFSDGSICNSHGFFKKNCKALQILLYNDEFEVVNPLGSKRLLHKVSGFYFTLGNLLPKYRSQLKNIHLSILVRYKLVQKYGYEPILDPLIQDLRKLQTEGVYLEVDGDVHNIKGSLAAVSTDNLTAHALAGFSGSFSNGRVCRYCMCHYNDLSTKIREEDCTLRTTEVHNYHLQCVQKEPNSRSIYGVMGPCVFSKVPLFDVTQGFPPDVMHDFLEGAVPHILKLLIRHLHRTNTVTVQELNRKIGTLKYGQNDFSNKPVLISEKIINDGKITGKAIEKWTLFRLLPFIIGNLVPEDNETWRLYLTLREIGEIILAPAISRQWLSYLTCVIVQFLSELNRLFPNEFIPKIHFLVHYPRLIGEFGPPRSHWCMRYEAKHLYFKKVASVINNFRNVCYSLSKRYQMHQCWEWNSRSSETESVPQAVSAIEFWKLPVHVRSYVKRSLHLSNSVIEDTETVWKTKRLHVDTVKYAVGDFFIVDLLHEEEIPQFVKILHILKFRTKWFLSGKLYSTTAFVQHLNAFSIKDSRAWLTFTPGDEVDYHPLDCYLDENDNLRVTLHHRPLKR